MPSTVQTWRSLGFDGKITNICHYIYVYHVLTQKPYDMFMDDIDPPVTNDAICHPPFADHIPRETHGVPHNTRKRVHRIQTFIIIKHGDPGIAGKRRKPWAG